MMTFTRVTGNEPLASPGNRAVALCLAMLLVSGLAGCATMQLASFNRHAKNGDYQWIATQTIACEKESDGCGRLHLAQGDACFHLAEAGNAPEVNYACAAHGLEKGLALKPSWEKADNRRQVQEKLCESLQKLQALQSGEAAGKTLDRFLDAAKGLYQLAPESVPAVYYLGRARLEQEIRLMDALNPTTRTLTCNRLKRNLMNILSTVETAKAGPLPGWDRYATLYHRLSFDIGTALDMARCR